MNLLFTVDKGNIDILSKCLKSIIRFDTEGGYDVYIMHPDLDDSDIDNLKRDINNYMDKNAIMRIHPMIIDMSKLNFIPEHYRYPKTMYYRLFASDLLPSDIDRILYLDPDIIVINSLDELYHMDMLNNLYLGCTHTSRVFTLINRIRLNMPKDAHYINTGVLLMNLSLLRKEDKHKEIIDIIENYGKYLALPDQDVISILYGNKTMIVNTLKYNLSDRMLKIHNICHPFKHINIEWLRYNGTIIHYCGRNKPWKDNYRGILNIFYNEVI